jgi:hypothetical protein
MNHSDIRIRNEKIIELGKQGVKLTDIGNRFGLRKSTVHRILKQNNISPIKIRTDELLDSYLKSQGYKDYRATGLTPEEYFSIPKELRKNLHRMLNSAKARAKAKGIECTIKFKDLLPVPTICPVLGIELNWNNSSNQDNSPSLDRLNNKKGYIAGNIAIMSYRANRIKSDSTLREISMLHEYLMVSTDFE